VHPNILPKISSPQTAWSLTSFSGEVACFHSTDAPLDISENNESPGLCILRLPVWWQSEHQGVLVGAYNRPSVVYQGTNVSITLAIMWKNRGFVSYSAFFGHLCWSNKYKRNTSSGVTFGQWLLQWIQH
jgi:hypothetical protein